MDHNAEREQNEADSGMHWEESTIQNLSKLSECAN